MQNLEFRKKKTLNSKLLTLNSKRGFGLIEILVVSAIIAIGFLAIISFLVFSRGVTFQSGRNAKATALAEEGIEAVRKIRAEGWTTNIAPLTTSATYYPVLVSSSWTLSASNPGLIDNLYARTVILEAVYRDGNDDIAASGALDPNSKKLIVTVSWTENSQSKSVQLTTYITNFLE